MTIPAVVVLDVPAGLGADLGAVAVRGCSVTLGARCAARDEVAAVTTESQSDGWLAVLTAPDVPSAVIRVELRPILRPVSVVAVRDLVFRPSDGPSERWATAGVVVAALVMDAESGRLPPADLPALPPPPPAASPKPPVKPAAKLLQGDQQPKPRREGEDRPLPLRIDLLALGGSSLDGLPWRFGGELRGALMLARTPLFGWLSLSGAGRGGELATGFWGVGLGGGVVAPLVARAIDAEIRLGVSGRGVRVVAEKGAERASATRWQGGILGGAEVVVHTSPRLKLVVGAAAAANRPRLLVREANEVKAEQSPLDTTITCGVRWNP